MSNINRSILSDQFDQDAFDEIDQRFDKTMKITDVFKQYKIPEINREYFKIGKNVVIIPCDLDSEDDRYKLVDEPEKEKVPEMDRDTVLFNQNIQNYLKQFKSDAI